MNTYLIGAGGVGGWLARPLCLLVGETNVIIIDGDTVEEKNLNRQLFEASDLGMIKSQTMAERCRCRWEPGWYSSGRFRVTQHDWLMVCADNHPARRDALVEADNRGCRVIIAANETYSSEAYYYDPMWQGTPLDPRVYYPDILTNHDGDPRAAAIGCTGEAQRQNPQLVSANAMAAALALNLLTLWKTKAHKLDAETRRYLPFKLVSNMTQLETHRISELQPQ